MTTTQIPNRFYRVNKAHPCPVCNHVTWCVFNHNVAICMRTENDHPKTFKGGEIGWVHNLSGVVSIPRTAPQPEHRPSINVTNLMKEWGQYDRTKDMQRFASSLSVSYNALESLECIKAPWYRSWGFPMQDGYGNYIGIRIRNEEGRKWAQPGSQAGIFVPRMALQGRKVVIVEGPTDAAAAIDMGFYPIGRPSCSGGVAHILALMKRRFIPAACIICDNDDPGIRGAADLQRWLPVPSCMLVLPTKDLREFSRIGDKSAIDAMISQLVWTQPRKAA